MQTTIIGRLGAAPELRFTSSGTPVTSFSVAYDKRRRTQAGEWETQYTTWVNVTCFDRLAKSVATAIDKGTAVIVVGDLHNRPYTDKAGAQRTSLELAAKHVAVMVLPARDDAGNLGQQAPQSTQGWGAPPVDEEPPF